MQKEAFSTSRDNHDRTIRGALELLRNVAGDKAERVREIISEDFHDLKDLIEDTAPAARQALGRVKEATKEASQKIDRTARQNTWSVVSIIAILAAGIGYLICKNWSSELRERD